MTPDAYAHAMLAYLHDSGMPAICLPRGVFFLDKEQTALEAGEVGAYLDTYLTLAHTASVAGTHEARRVRYGERN